MENMKERVKKAREKAIDAFWNTFAAEFPEIETGDLEPSTAILIDKTFETITDLWIEENS